MGKQMKGKDQGHFTRKFTSLFMIINPNLKGITIPVSYISPNFLQSMSQNKLAIKENIKAPNYWESIQSVELTSNWALCSSVKTNT